MLNYIRDNIQSVVVKIFVTAIAVVMLFFGVNSFESQNLNVLVSIGNQDITVDEYQRAYSVAEREYFARFKEQARMVIEQTNLNKQVLSRLVNSALLVESAKKNGLTATELEIAAAIQNQPELQTEGRFDKAKYYSFLERNRISAKDFEKDLSKKIITSKYYDLVASGQSVSKSYVASTYVRDETQFKAQVLKLDPKRYQVKATPTEKELQAFYEENKASYTLPKEYQIQYFTLDSADEVSRVNVRPKELEKYYQRNKEKLVIKTAFDSSHILLQVPQGANAAAVKVIQKKAELLAMTLKRKPSAFATMAKKHSQDPGSAKQGGKIGWKTQGSLVASYEAKMATMKQGEISSPVKSRFGFHIIQLHNQIAGRQLSFEEAKPQIQAEISLKKAKRRLKNQVAKLKKGLEAATIAQSGEGLGATVEKSESFGPQGMLPKTGSTYSLYQALSLKKVGEKGTLFVNEEAQAIVYELVAVKDERVQGLSEVKAQVTKSATEEFSALRSTEKMLAAAQKITSGSQMKQVARTQKSKVKQVSFLYKDTTIPNLKTTRNFQIQILAMQTGDVRVIIDQDKAYIVKLDQKTNGQIQGNDKLVALEDYLKQKKAELILKNLLDAHAKTVEVVYNQKIMEALRL